MARPRDRAEITPEIKGGLKRALKIMEAQGRPLSTIWVELFEEDKATAMRLAIQLLPKELDVTATVMQPEDWLEAMADRNASNQRQGTSTEDAVSGLVPGLLPRLPDNTH